MSMIRRSRSRNSNNANHSSTGRSEAPQVALPSEPLGRDPDHGYDLLFPPTPSHLVPWGDHHRGCPSSVNRLIWGEALHISRLLPDACLDLIYLDPPFFTGSIRRGPSKAAARTQQNSSQDAGSPQEGGPKVYQYSDCWQGDLALYLAWLNAHLDQARRLLKPDGSLFLHLDSCAIHYAKVEADKIFGLSALVNEIIWWYRTGGGSSRRFGRKHDTLLFYAKTPGKHRFYPDEVRTPYDANIADKRRHLFNPKGKIMPDVWSINRPPNHAQEWLGYPTQKPLALLDRIIRCTTLPGDKVADFFCGSGTTAHAASALDRTWLVMDESQDAIQLTAKRLEASHHPFQVEKLIQ